MSSESVESVGIPPEVNYKALCTKMSGDLVCALTRLLLLKVDIHKPYELGENDISTFYSAYEVVVDAYPEATLPEIPEGFRALRRLAFSNEPWMQAWGANRPER